MLLQLSEDPASRMLFYAASKTDPKGASPSTVDRA